MNEVSIESTSVAELATEFKKSELQEVTSQISEMSRVLAERAKTNKPLDSISKKVKESFAPGIENHFFKYILVLMVLIFSITAVEAQNESDEDGRNRYYETGYELIDQEGVLEVNAPEILYGDHFSMALTVNIYDGTVTIFNLDGNGGTEEIFQTHALVGERLLFNRDSERLLGLFPDQFPSFSSRGLYDFQNGVFSDNYGLRHTLTPPLIADFQGFGKIPGFGGLDATTDIAFIRSMSSDGRVSGYNSQYTFHEVPPLESDHYNQRRALLAAANANNEAVEDPYWSHGCVNIDPEVFPELKIVLDNEERAGGNVVIIFSTPGQDQSKHFRGPSFDGTRDLFFGTNLFEAADEVDTSRPAYTAEILSPDILNTGSTDLDSGEDDNDGSSPPPEPEPTDTQLENTVVNEVSLIFSLENWHHGESFLDYSVTERASSEVRELPFFARDMVSEYVENNMERDNSLVREELAEEGLALWSYAFPDGNTNPSPRSDVQDDVFAALYLGDANWTFFDLRNKWLNQL